MPPNQLCTPDPGLGASHPRIQAGLGPIPDLPAFECLLLAVAHHWSIRGPFNRQVELLDRFFDQDQMKTALTKLEGAAGLPRHANRRTGATKTATRAQAEDVAMAIKTLGELTSNCLIANKCFVVIVVL